MQARLGIAAHQAEAEEDIEEEREQQCEEWDFGNENTYLKGYSACEHCSEENDQYPRSLTRGKQMA